MLLTDHNFKALFHVSDTNDPVFVHDIGWHKTLPKHTYGPAVRPYYLLHLIESGKGEIERNGVVTPLSVGQAFLIHPNEVTTYRADKDEPWTYRWISFSGSFSKTLMDRTTNKLHIPYRQSGLLALKTALDNKIEDSLSFLNVLFQVLNSIKTLKAPPQDDIVKSALHYIENNYFQEFDVFDLATTLGYSRSYFSSVFSKQTGTTPHRYLTQIRLKKAQQLLTETSLSVEEVAYSVGFASLQRFSESFKQHIGITPSQYRSNSKS